MKKEKVIGVGSYHVSKDGTKLVCIGLGSCVGIVIYDKRKKQGGLAHAMLPRYQEGRDKKNASKYADASVYIMIDELLAYSSNKKDLVAKLVGGSQMFSFMESDTLDIGRRNATAAKHALEKEGIKIIAEDLGGSQGRTVEFNPKTGELIVKKNGNNVKSI